MVFFETLELAVENICQPNVEMSFDCRAREEVFNEIVKMRRVIDTVLVEKAIDHAPRPGLDEICISLCNLVPEFVEFLGSCIFVSSSKLGEDVSVECADGDSGNNLVFSLASSFHRMRETFDCASLIWT